MTRVQTAKKVRGHGVTVDAVYEFLKEEYPNLYSTLLREDFKCPIGWAENIYRLSRVINNRKPDCRVTLVSVTTNGNLLFYVSDSSEEVREAIELVKGICKDTCRNCGVKEVLLVPDVPYRLCKSCNRDYAFRKVDLASSEMRKWLQVIRKLK